MMGLKPYITTPEDAVWIAYWLGTKGGIALWRSVDFTRSGQTVHTPVNTSEGEPHPKPAYWVANKPARLPRKVRGLRASD